MITILIDGNSGVVGAIKLKKIIFFWGLKAPTLMQLLEEQ